MQDLLGHFIIGLGLYAHEGRRVGVIDQKVNRFTAEALFSTLTNVNFDADRFAEFINEAAGTRAELSNRVSKAGGNVDFDANQASLKPAGDLKSLIKRG